MKPNVPMYVPVEILWHGKRPNRIHHNTWMQVSNPVCDSQGTCAVSWDDTWYPSWGYGSSGDFFANNENRTNLIPCCGLTGNPAHMATDEVVDTYWDSGVTEQATLTMTVEDEQITSLDSIDIWWTQDYARDFRVMVSCGSHS